MNWIDIQKTQPPLNPKRMLVIKLWDKVIPVAHIHPCDEACVPVRTVCEMLNLDFEVELEELLEHDYLHLQTVLVNYNEEVAKLMPELSDFFINVSALTVWIPGKVSKRGLKNTIGNYKKIDRKSQVEGNPIGCWKIL